MTNERGGDGYTDHERWLRAMAPLIVAHERSDDGDSTPETIYARYVDKPIVASMDAYTAMQWALMEIENQRRVIADLRRTVDALNEARTSGRVAAS